MSRSPSMRPCRPSIGNALPQRACRGSSAGSTGTNSSNERPPSSFANGDPPCRDLAQRMPSAAINTGNTKAPMPEACSSRSLTVAPIEPDPVVRWIGVARERVPGGIGRRVGGQREQQQPREHQQTKRDQLIQAPVLRRREEKRNHVHRGLSGATAQARALPLSCPLPLSASFLMGREWAIIGAATPRNP